MRIANRSWTRATLTRHPIRAGALAILQHGFVSCLTACAVVLSSYCGLFLFSITMKVELALVAHSTSQGMMAKPTIIETFFPAVKILVSV